MFSHWFCNRKRKQRSSSFVWLLKTKNDNIKSSWLSFAKSTATLSKDSRKVWKFLNRFKRKSKTQRMKLKKQYQSCNFSRSVFSGFSWQKTFPALARRTGSFLLKLFSSCLLHSFRKSTGCQMRRTDIKNWVMRSTKNSKWRKNQVMTSPNTRAPQGWKSSKSQKKSLRSFSTSMSTTTLMMTTLASGIRFARLRPSRPTRSSTSSQHTGSWNSWSIFWSSFPSPTSSST